jgi:hypothetical protein
MDRPPLEVADLIRAAGPDFIERSHTQRISLRDRFAIPPSIAGLTLSVL